MREVNIYLVSGINSMRKGNGYVAYCLEYYPAGKRQPETLIDTEPVFDMTGRCAELEVLVKALKRLKEKCILSIYTESEYLNMGIGERRLVDKLQENDWKAGKNVEVKNKEKWQEMLILLNGNEYQLFLKQSNAYAEMLHEKVRMKGEIRNTEVKTDDKTDCT